MTGIVLALAGLTCSDGGPGTGAARALTSSPLEVGEGFTGYIRLTGGNPYPTRFRNGTVEIYHGRLGRDIYYECSLSPDGPGRFRLRFRRALCEIVYPGSVRWEGGKAVLVLDEKGPCTERNFPYDLDEADTRADEEAAQRKATKR